MGRGGAGATNRCSSQSPDPIQSVCGRKIPQCLWVSWEQVRVGGGGAYGCIGTRAAPLRALCITQFQEVKQGTFVHRVSVRSGGLIPVRTTPFTNAMVTLRRCLYRLRLPQREASKVRCGPAT